MGVGPRTPGESEILAVLVPKNGGLPVAPTGEVDGTCILVDAPFMTRGVLDGWKMLSEWIVGAVGAVFADSNLLESGGPCDSGSLVGWVGASIGLVWLNRGIRNDF